MILGASLLGSLLLMESNLKKSISKFPVVNPPYLEKNPKS